MTNNPVFPYREKIYFWMSCNVQRMGKYICQCYFNRNIFLKQYNLHVTFINEEQFAQDYSDILKERGLKEHLSKVIDQIQNEVVLRKQNGAKSYQRRIHIENNYVPMHKELYTLQEGFLTQTFLDLARYSREEGANRTSLIKKIKQCTATGVFSFPVFENEFCKKFVEELKQFEESEMPKGRPNTMNTTGLLLEEMGFYPNFIDPLRTNYLAPISKLLFPDWVGDDNLDSQRAFVVSYKHANGEDMTDLALHFDNAEVTLNVSLCDGFEGGELFFSGMWKEKLQRDFKCIEHVQSYGILHRGRHLHGAMPLQSGERYNLIIWMRSSSVRNKHCPMCGEIPTLVATQSEGDGFTTNEVVNVCSVV